MPSMRKAQSPVPTWGVGPAVSTGKPRSAYSPGGRRSANSSGVRRPVNPPRTKSVIAPPKFPRADPHRTGAEPPAVEEGEPRPGAPPRRHHDEQADTRREEDGGHRPQQDEEHAQTHRVARPPANADQRAGDRPGAHSSGHQTVDPDAPVVSARHGWPEDGPRSEGDEYGDAENRQRYPHPGPRPDLVEPLPDLAPHRSSSGGHP